jgi:YXWGXW repeat-containing protein
MKITRLVRSIIFALLMLTLCASAFAGVFVQVTVGPPALPVYAQPPCPGDGYIWTPGYWAYGPDGYYWVPGTWVLAPEPGLLWTPGYWGWSAGFYVWHPGYWGPHVGFYGGINYGFGYLGVGYAGGYWEGRNFYYNRTVNNINITNVHIYNKTVINNVTVNRVSYNGGHGGVMARPSHDEMRWEHERHFEATGMQREHEHGAAGNRELLASVNHGKPSVAATGRPGDFHGREMVRARGGNDRPMDNRGMNREVPRAQNSGRNMDRPMPRQDARNDMHNMDRRQDNFSRDDQRMASRPDNRMETRGGGHTDSGRGHENAAQPGREEKGHERR